MYNGAVVGWARCRVVRIKRRAWEAREYKCLGPGSEMLQWDATKGKRLTGRLYEQDGTGLARETVCVYVCVREGGK